MRSLCIKSIEGFKAGVTYNSCPVLCGYQISPDTERSFYDCDIKSIKVFLGENYKQHFKTV